MNTKEEIVRLRTEIRSHRDQRGDDRCWLDDEKVWVLLPESFLRSTTLPEFSTMMAKCRAFYRYRGTRTTPIQDVQPAVGDDDLETMGEEELRHALNELQNAIRTHRDVTGRERTYSDDAALYSILPERLAADFSLPPEEEFLGEGRAPVAGCPSFWRSHAACGGEHTLSAWGPC